MSLRFTLCAVVLSLFLGCLLFFLFFLFIPLEPGAGLCVLTMDEGEGEERLAALLGPGGFTGESGQWVFLADFGGRKRIPLGEYAGALEDFDPRHDGFAARLRAFFVREGKRFMFIPLRESGFAERKGLEKKLGSLGEDIPFTLDFLIFRRPILPFFIFFAAAFVLAFFLGGRTPPMLLLLPLLAPLAWGGYAGLALGGLFSGMWGFAGDPLREFFARRRYGRSLPGFSGGKGGFAGKSPFFSNGLGVFLLLLLIVPVALLGGLPLPPLAAGGAGFLALLLLSFRFEAGGGNHVRFIPLRILSRRREGLRPLILMAPFTLASVAGFSFSLFFAVPLPGPASTAVLDDRYFINKGDYEAHADFQASFFLRPLGGGPSEGYFRYYLDEDGLIGGRDPHGEIPGEAGEEENPPFPLEELMNFLIHYKQAGEENSSPRITVKDWMLMVLVIMPLVPLFFRADRAGKKRRGLSVPDKRIAA